MNDPFRDVRGGVESPALGSVAVTPSDSTPLTKPVRAVTIGVAGVLTYKFQDVTYTTNPLPIGNYPMRADQILATGTTAGEITGWF